MKKTAFKKVLAVLLSATMITSVMSVSCISAGATEDIKNYYVPAEETETITVYFYMPDGWYNEYTDTAGVYWWEGTDACPSWQEMYAMNPTETENIYSIEIPVDVPYVIFNNYFDGGENPDNPEYMSAKLTQNLKIMPEEEDGDSWVYFPGKDEYIGDSDLYKEGLASVDGMIFVIDELLSPYCSDSYNRVNFGEWYYYYGNGEYGFTPEKGDVVYTEQHNDLYLSVDKKYKNVAVPEDAKIYFDVESAGWKNYKNIYCHIWRADGTGEWPKWQSKKELCTLEDNGKYSYTLSKTGNEFKYSDENIYAVIFSTDTGIQTYELVMNGGCIRDTVCIIPYDDNTHAPSDSEIKLYIPAWRRATDGGARKRIIPSGDIIGWSHFLGDSDETMLADFIIKYYDIDFSMGKLNILFETLCVDATNVLNEIKLKEDKAVIAGEKTQMQADAEYAEIEKIIENVFLDDNLIHDINKDYYTDVNDVTTLQMYIAYYDVDVDYLKIDVDDDDIVDVRDVTALQLYLAS